MRCWRQWGPLLLVVVVPLNLLHRVVEWVVHWVVFVDPGVQMKQDPHRLLHQLASCGWNWVPRLVGLSYLSREVS